ncbi:aldehyde dehydrogenase [Roseixanthobacter pseudopolyaromaticivorans]|uniref:aldehyde dehydrogenase n=1 Tax=Xanthobacteraceae TaxID=335928 RepID=UPI003727677A
MNAPLVPDARNTYGNFIAGKDAQSADGRTFVSFNPTTGKPWGTFADSSAHDVDAAVNAASAAFSGPWGALSPTRRGRLLMKWGDRIAEHAERIAAMETAQNGKLYSEMRTQATIVQDWLYYFGGLADKVEGTVIPLDRTSVFNYTLREPLGVVAVIVPWNSPTFLTIMALAPALAAGNTVVIKPSEVTSASAIELARLAVEAGIPPGVVNVVTGLRGTGEALVDHPKVAKINFTGGDAGGRAIASAAGKRLVSSILELGGKSPNIVFADADLDRAEAGVLAGIFAAAGQTCVAGSRAYIQRPIYDRFVERLVGRASGIVLGDPMKAETQMGPVATSTQLAKDESMVRQAVADGAEILFGGARASVAEFPDGYFFSPTILHNVDASNCLVRQEVFGPVLAVIPFDDEAEVLQAANDTPFGLASGVWTRDLRRAHLMARRLQAGTVWINTYRAMAFNSPFGGHKDSGLGHQNGIGAIQQYLQTKSVWCELSEEIQDPFVIKA